MQEFQKIPQWAIILAIVVLCCCCIPLLGYCLKTESFSNNSGTHVKLTNYWASWCGWSNKFKPEWDSFANALNADSQNAEAADFDCAEPKDDDDEETKNKKLENVKKCKESGVDAFPTVIIEVTKDGKTEKIDYQGQRTKAALDEKVKELLR